MPVKKVIGEFQGHRFTVENTWFHGMKFFHNEELLEVDNRNVALNKNKPCISVKVMLDNVERLVEVYVYAMWTVKIQIRVDGEKIAGDDF